MFHQFFGVAGRASNVGHGKGSYTTEMFQADFPQFYKAEMDENKYGEKAVTIERMARMEYGDSVAKWSEKGASFGTSLSGFSLDSMVAQPIKSISSDTSAIRKAVSMSEEDLRSLVDVAERKYVNKINMTQLTPSIVINGANTGKTADDRRALADAIKEVLIEQTASGASVATAYV